MLEVVQWKRWVDSVQVDSCEAVSLSSSMSQTSDRDSFDAQYAYFQRLRSERDKNVRRLVDSSGTYSRADLFWIRRHLILEYFLYDTNPQPYMTIVDCVWQGLSGPSDLVVLTGNDSLWMSAVRAVKRSLSVEPQRYNTDLLELGSLYSRESIIAQSGKELIRGGYAVRVEGGRIYMDRGERLRLAQKIDNDIKWLGAHKTARYLIDSGVSGDAVERARAYLARLTFVEETPPEPLIPVAYLLNLCVKHLEDRRISAPFEQTDLDRTLKLSKLFASVYDVQPYSKVEQVVWSRHNFIEKLVDYALFDRLFVVPEWRPSEVPKIIRGLFQWVDQLDEAIGWTSEDAATVAERILELGKDNVGPHLISESTLKQKLADLDPHVSNHLVEIFSHNRSEVNESFLLPDEPPEDHDLMFKPLIKIENGDYCLMHWSSSAPAFYEALATDLRNARKGKTVDKSIGDNLEEFVRRLLSSDGRKCYDGNYYSGLGRNGQVDAIVETSDSILLFEVKKKALTRGARAGHPVKVVLDLVKTQLRSMEQLTRAAASLEETGQLTLMDLAGKSESVIIESRGRIIKRICVSLDSFGAFHTRAITEKFLEFVYTTGFGVRDQQFKKDIDEINKKAMCFREAQIRLSEASNERYRWPFRDCLFIALPHLLYILDDVSDEDSLDHALSLTLYMDLGTRDFYHEYDRAKAVRPRPQATDKP